MSKFGRDAAARARFPNRYADLVKVPRCESLLDTMERCVPLWEDRIKRDLLAGRNVMVVAHGNSLRGLVKHARGRVLRRAPPRGPAGGRRERP